MEIKCFAVAKRVKSSALPGRQVFPLGLDLPLEVLDVDGAHGPVGLGHLLQVILPLAVQGLGQTGY